MNEKVSMLKEKAKELRKTALTMIFEAQSGHPGGSLSSADIVTALYFSESCAGVLSDLSDISENPMSRSTENTSSASDFRQITHISVEVFCRFIT